MTPYADFLYFGVLLYVVVPTLILGLVGRGSGWWIALATVAMLTVQYGDWLRIEPGIEVREIWILAGYALFEWAVARGFLQVRGRGRWPFYLAVLLAVSPMVVAKYVPLVAPHFQFGFLGISYVTLRTLDVVFCSRDRLITSLAPLQFFAYLFFFGTISSGPIDRYRRFATDWTHRRSRAEFLVDLDGAVQRIFTGFLYKFILAAVIKQHWLDPAAAQPGVLGTLSYMYAYSFYLFFDFAGYSAFAIAVSYVFGIHTPENFNRPFLARNIRDFWNRWNITLSWWLRDHIYMRFVMAAMKGRWFPSKYLASSAGLFLAFGLMGLWHGTALHYLLYGVYHGALLSAHETFARWNKQRGLWGDSGWWQAAGVFGTFHCVCFGFLLFSGHLTGGGVVPLAAADRGADVYEGRYEKASCDEIVGWVRDRRDPQHPLDVDIYADGARLATVRADLFRQDLVHDGGGTGAHGFVYVPPPAVKDGWPHQIEVRVTGAAVALGEHSRPIVCALTGTSMDGYDGGHDTTTCEHIGGWAWDATAPERNLRVDIYDGAVLIGSAAADQAAHGRTHAFTYPTTAQLRDGRPHSISIRIAGTAVALRNTPQVLSCPQGGPPPATATPTVFTGQAPAAAGPGAATPVAPPSYRDNGDGTISALHTGLVWEKKVGLDRAGDAANLHDADNCYPWFGSCSNGGAECKVDADCGANARCTAEDCQTPAPGGLTIFEWVTRLNATEFAGHDDWRLPTSSELYSIVNPLEDGEAATKAAFTGASCGAACASLTDPACSCTHPGLYWAAPKAAPNPDDSWMMFFYCNGHLFLDLQNNRFHVRAVRGLAIDNPPARVMQTPRTDLP